MTDLTQLNLADARDGLAKKQFSAVELTQAHIDRVSASSALNAYVLETP
jgi:aspartyl-tRNA(Asn)/glutamyl-tRNA(Gln) amidotransferase subunit A